MFSNQQSGHTQTQNSSPGLGTLKGSFLVTLIATVAVGILSSNREQAKNPEADPPNNPSITKPFEPPDVPSLLPSNPINTAQVLSTNSTIPKLQIEPASAPNLSTSFFNSPHEIVEMPTVPPLFPNPEPYIPIHKPVLPVGENYFKQHPDIDVNNFSIGSVDYSRFTLKDKFSTTTITINSLNIPVDISLSSDAEYKNHLLEITDNQHFKLTGLLTENNLGAFTATAKLPNGIEISGGGLLNPRDTELAKGYFANIRSSEVQVAGLTATGEINYGAVQTSSGDFRSEASFNVLVVPKTNGNFKVKFKLGGSHLQGEANSSSIYGNVELGQRSSR